MIKKIVIFSWTLVKQLVIYTLSVIPASFVDAINAATGDRYVRHEEGIGLEPSDPPHRRKRRGHRGGRKHRKFHNH